MFLFSNPQIELAGAADVPALCELLNSAYRGEASKKGWTSEAHLIEGDTRATHASVEEVMQKPGSVFLKYTGTDQALTGCVNLQPHERGIYLGMFSVSPALQGGGVGKKLLAAAEEYARKMNIPTIYMTVISVRTELIQWYQRHGYRDTGERKPFPETEDSGKHLQPLEFMVLEKNV